MGLLPAYVEDDDALIEELVEDLPQPTEYEIDFSTGELTGRIVKDIEAIKTWIYLALNTPRYRYSIFSWNYGSECEELIGQQYTQDAVESEIQRMTEECLLECPYISEIESIETRYENTNLIINVTVQTDYGDITQEVSLNAI